MILGAADVHARDAAVGGHERDVAVGREPDRVLVGVQAGDRVPRVVGAQVDGHVLPRDGRRGDAAVGGADHAAAVGARRLACVGGKLVVVHRAAEPHLVRVAGRAGDEHVVAALALAEAERREAVVAVRLVRELCPRRVGVAAVGVAADGADVPGAEHARLREVVGGVAEVGARGGAGVDEIELRAVTGGVARVVRIVEVRLVERVVDLRPGRPAVLRAPEPVAEHRRVQRRRVVRVELQPVDAALEPVGAGAGAGVGRVLRRLVRQVLLQDEVAAVGGLVDAQLRCVGRRAAPAVHRRGAVARDRGADVDRPRVGRVDRDRADRAVGGDRRAAGDERPRGAEVGRLEQAQARLGVARAVLLARAGVQRLARRRRRAASRRRWSAGHRAARSTPASRPARRRCARCRRRRPRPTRGSCRARRPDRRRSPSGGRTPASRARSA